MSYLITLALVIGGTFASVFGIYNFVPLDVLQPIHQNQNFGSTITTINGSDTLSSSRSVINTNFSNLNTDKFELSTWYATTSAAQITTLANLSTVGTITSGTWNGTAVTVTRGGTGVATFTASQLIYGNSTNALSSVATTSIAVSSGLTVSGTLGAQVGGASVTLKQLENRSFSYATTSAWTATTSIPLEIGYGEVWNTVKCTTGNQGTLNVQFGYGSASTTMFNASSTAGTITFTTNNTMTVGNKVKVDIGTPASLPVNIACTVNDTI